MTRSAAYALVAALAIACLLQAQAPPTIASETKQAWTSVRGNLLRAAEKMPEAEYASRPSPDIRTFGEMIGHIADSALRSCAGVKGEQRTADASTKKTKADLVAALKSSLDYCDSAYESLTDANALEVIKAGRGQRTRAGALVYNNVHMNESYGYIAVYMRARGVVPPSSEPRQ
jgi:uncharacterized damage-inducible protein DinB